MTAFHLKGSYYELTLFMDLWNNEILSYSLSSRKGDRMTYIHGLEGLIELKKKIQILKWCYILIKDLYILQKFQ